MTYMLKATFEGKTKPKLVLEVFDEKSKKSVHKVVTSIEESDSFLEGYSILTKEDTITTDSSIRLMKTDTSREAVWDKMIYYILRQVFFNLHTVPSYKSFSLTTKEVDKKDKDFLLKTFRKYLEK